jgi:hypothetical protein
MPLSTAAAWSLPARVVLKWPVGIGIDGTDGSRRSSSGPVSYPRLTDVRHPARRSWRSTHGPDPRTDAAARRIGDQPSLGNGAAHRLHSQPAGDDPALYAIQCPAQGWAAERVTCSTKSVRVRQRPRRRDRSSPDAQEKTAGSSSDGGWWSWQETESTPSLATLADRVYQVHIVD